jgi:hypothetical protein
MAHLLVVSRLQSKALQRKGSVPLALEFPVSSETAPYLVSGTSTATWVQEPRLEGPEPDMSMVRAAVRACTPGEFFRDVVEAVVAMGREARWGNVHPLSEEGLLAAVAHLDYYDLGPVELLTPRAHPKASSQGADEDVESVDLMPPELRPLIEATGLPFRPSSWVPDGMIVVVPRDRAFVGVLKQVTPRKIAAVVHNPARGIAVVQRGTDELVEPAPLSTDLEGGARRVFSREGGEG